MVTVIGYGSLMIPDSLQKTIPLREFRLVWTNDYKRVFNLKTKMLRFYRVSEQSNQVAILNVEFQQGGRFNAVAFDVNQDELGKLRIREKNYYTKEVRVYDFGSEREIGNAVLFIGNKFAHGERIVSNDYLPVPSYMQRCREAAYGFGEPFGIAFDSTTFLGDGTSLEMYLKKADNP
jgi:cation transport regulator ChaC